MTLLKIEEYAYYFTHTLQLKKVKVNYSKVIETSTLSLEYQLLFFGHRNDLEVIGKVKKI